MVHRKSSTSLSPDVVEYLKSWMMSPEHITHPYPTEEEKLEIMSYTGIGIKQLTNWFVNNRRRYWKPLMSTETNDFSKTASVSPLKGRNRRNVNHSRVIVLNPKSLNGKRSRPPTLSHYPEFGLLGDSLSTQPENRTTTYGCSSPNSLSSEQSYTESGATDHSTTDYTSWDELLHPSPISVEYGTYQDEVNCMVEETDAALNSSGSSSDFEEDDSSSSSIAITLSRKRKFGKDTDIGFKRSILDWKDACLKAKPSFDDLSLPSLEEATILFGFAM